MYMDSLKGCHDRNIQISKLLSLNSPDEDT